MTKTAKQQRVALGTGRPGGHHLIPEIRQIGWGKFDIADPEHLVPHQHPGAFEICLILSGEVEWETQDQSYVLRAGDLFITKPDETHWGRDNAMQPCSLYWMHLDQDSRDGWLGFPEVLGANIREKLNQMPRQIKGDSSAIAAIFKQIFDEHQRPDTEDWTDDLKASSARASLHRLVIELVRLSEQSEVRQAPTEYPSLVRRAIAAMRDPFQEALSNREIAATVGTSAAHLNNLFIHYAGMSLTQYSLRERVRVARGKLSGSDQSVTEIANELGFSSSQHFATAFKRMTGISPSAYRSGSMMPDRDQNVGHAL